MSTKWIVVGLNERNFLGEGWYGLEKSPEGMMYRASSKTAQIECSLSGSAKVVFHLSARPEHVGESLRVAVSTGEQDGFTFELVSNQWTTRTGELVLEKNVPITLHVENPWSPGALYENADLRSLGILLTAMRMSLLEKHE